mmetsp:Transcript_23330/g.67274  ORF Transcript_23330/g.67274 Transcript_23330/m.67274 type:complete len:257 (+) Transcript_23330:96-866(+)|eukprot:CAMPEP_0181052480 /NCGR_PEP_ID=MMETSP1070-20121207/17612_1 /TAXON_ID=265543 /ORGANISM="Minutocellus polymorphus, Strain NH13" /LENGTH=256 /DNA_ID=CAMNT_0023131575 /DNA_START=23 /DNA_END=793 /DNA_ORIENTATION=-
MFLSTGFVTLALISLISNAAGLSPFDRLTASQRLEAAFHARRMLPSEADQKCIDDINALFSSCNCTGDANVTEPTELEIAQGEALALCDGYVEEILFRNVTTDEGTVNETTVEVLEALHLEFDFFGCDHVSLWEGECIDAGGFVASVPDLDLRCLTDDEAPLSFAGAVFTSSIRGLDDCFAASCESTVQKLQSGLFDDILGLPMLAGPVEPFAECEVTLVDDQVPDDTTTSSAISMTTNSFLVGGIFISLVALVTI